MQSLKIPQNTYYKALLGVPSKRQIEADKLKAEIKEIYIKSKCHYSTSMTAELAVNAVKNACLNVKNTKGIILYSDLGIQYTSYTFEDYLSSKGIVHSFSRKGNPYDDACIESFPFSIEKERNQSS